MTVPPPSKNVEQIGCLRNREFEFCVLFFFSFSFLSKKVKVDTCYRKADYLHIDTSKITKLSFLWIFSYKEGMSKHHCLICRDYTSKS